ncbi:hypothetical protein EMCRGX_G020912 [Ephydatia muelleri]
MVTVYVASSGTKKSPKFTVLKDQPELLGGPSKLKLRDYQLDGMNFLVHSWCNSMVLSSWLSLPAWQIEFELLSPNINVVVLIGDNRSRQKIYQYKWAHPNSQMLS